ncbi:hypothetical protein F5887DRAFT_977169 [Amanita rubescens]|nr:hypothetical protein F5887DRAFT_977169 [Amanita rubescens]
MSVTSRAPIEILCEIFLLLCDKPIALHHLTNGLHFDEFPWAVGQVCSHWRLAFLSYPPLWSSLTLNDPGSEDLASRSVLQAYHPLTIIVRTSNPSFSTIWVMLLSYSNRWQKADLWIGNESAMNPLVGRKGEMQILESLRIILPKFKGQKVPMAFDIAPHLTKLELTYWEGLKEWTLRRWLFPWIQLSKLKLEVICLDFTRKGTLRAFLLQIQNVEELRFFMTFAEDEFGDFKCPSVHFPRLRLLEISLVSPGVFSWFEAPLLEHLLVQDSCQGRDDYGEELSSLVHRSSCCVRHLTIQDCDIHVACGIIEVLSGIEELCVKQMCGAVAGDFSDFARDMIQSDSIQLPNLRVVQVPCCPGHFKQLILGVVPFFDRQSGESGSAPAGTSIAPLEKLIITVDRNNCGCGQCGVFDEESTAIDFALKIMSRIQAPLRG